MAINIQEAQSILEFYRIHFLDKSKFTVFRNWFQMYVRIISTASRPTGSSVKYGLLSLLTLRGLWAPCVWSKG